MTSEEIFKKNFPQFVTEKGVCLSPFWDLFDAGIEAGRLQWHKVADGDLPTEEKDYLVKLTDGTVDIRRVALDGDLEPYLLTPKFDFYKDIEKWCEIPEE